MKLNIDIKGVYRINIKTMKKKITQKVDSYMGKFKNDIKTYIQENNIEVNFNGEDHIGEFLKYIYDYGSLEFEETDFQKRKRVKNRVPDFNRCCALKFDGTRCSRKIKNETEGHYCGTHLKGIPYGSILDNVDINVNEKEKKVEVWFEEINGIMWYIDKNNNVYDSNDIVSGNKNPKIIDKVIKNQDGNYEFVK